MQAPLWILVGVEKAYWVFWNRLLAERTNVHYWENPLYEIKSIIRSVHIQVHMKFVDIDQPTIDFLI